MQTAQTLFTFFGATHVYVPGVVNSVWLGGTYSVIISTEPENPSLLKFVIIILFSRWNYFFPLLSFLIPIIEFRFI
jgi:hypothetical protein